MIRRAIAVPTERLAEQLGERPAERPDPRDDEEANEPSATSLRRWHLMERIMELNATARAEYLEDFGDDSLARYLAHLESVGSPRGARWERPGDSPAIMVRETAF